MEKLNSQLETDSHESQLGGALERSGGGMSLLPPPFQLQAGGDGDNDTGTNPSIGSRQAPIQATLIDASELGEKGISLVEPSGNIAIYYDIIDLVAAYNAKYEEDDADYLPRLKNLDAIEKRTREWKVALDQESGGIIMNADRGRAANLETLRASIAQEKAGLLQDNTEEKSVLSGSDAKITDGKLWYYYDKGESVWKDATSILKVGETLDVKINQEEDDGASWGFSFDKGLRGKAAKDVFDLQTQFTQVDGALYPSGSPQVDDVKQTNLGDCYLQAALASLAQQNPGKIEEMLYDNGDDVVVRLYEMPDRTPRLIRVEKSIVQDLDGQNYYNDGALWVKMIQKAYAASGLGTGLGQKGTVSIGDISGHLSGYALNVLTGGELVTHTVGGVLEVDDPSPDNILPWGLEVSTLGDFLDAEDEPEAESADKEDYDKGLNLLKGIFGPLNMPLVQGWAVFVFENSHADGLKEKKTIEEVGQYLVDENLAEGIRNPFMIWLRAARILPGQVGSGVYTRNQMTLFGKLSEAVADKKTLTTGTKKKLTQEDTGQAGATGEQKYNGLAGGHAYSILNTKGNATSNPASDEVGTYCWIQLRNPWGHYGRSYNTDQAAWRSAAVEQGNGIFWIELTDFVQNFEDAEEI